MAHYRFETEWVLDAPVEDVFTLLTEPDDSGYWGPSTMATEILDLGDETGIGRTAAYQIRSPLLYTINFDARIEEIEPPRRVVSNVSGDLEGTGTYELAATHEGTRVRFHWHVTTTKGWMNLFAPIGRPFFVWAHDRVMRSAIDAMAARLNAELISWRSRLVDVT